MKLTPFGLTSAMALMILPQHNQLGRAKNPPFFFKGKAMDKKQRMKNGESIRDVFATPEEVGPFIRSLISELESSEDTAMRQRKAFSIKADIFRNNLFSAMYEIQKQHNLTMEKL